MRRRHDRSLAISDWESRRPAGRRPCRPHPHRNLPLTAIAYLQPVTRGEISKLAGREIRRDSIASLKRRGFIDGAIRAPQPGAPFAYVTTRKFLEVFGFASLRDLPDLERLKAEGPMQRGRGRPSSTARSGWRTSMRSTSTPHELDRAEGL
jgi:hypothetical protein